MRGIEFDRRAFAAVAIVLSRDRVLAVTRRGKDGDWSFPGGKREPGETLRRCAWRELREETGVVADEEGMAHVFTGWDAHGNEVSAFLVREWTGEPHPTEHGISVAWLDTAQLVDPSSSTFHEYNRAALNVASNLEWR